MSDEQLGHIAQWKLFLQKHKKILEDAYFTYYIIVVKQLIISYDSWADNFTMVDIRITA